MSGVNSVDFTCQLSKLRLYLSDCAISEKWRTSNSCFTVVPIIRTLPWVGFEPALYHNAFEGYWTDQSTSDMWGSCLDIDLPLNSAQWRVQNYTSLLIGNAVKQVFDILCFSMIANFRLLTDICAKTYNYVFHKNTFKQYQVEASLSQYSNDDNYYFIS